MLTTDILIDPATSNNRPTGLKVTSVLRLHKLATLHRSSLVRLLGKIDANLKPSIDAKLRQLLGI